MSVLEDIPGPVLAVGDRLRVWLPVDNEETTVKRKAKITAIKRSKKIKHESWYQYTLQFDDGDEQTTRLLHLKYKVSKKTKKRPPPDVEEEEVDTSTAVKNKKQRSSRSIPSHQRILAPMVGGSELAFRLLCRRYGCDLAYTPMMNSQRFVVDSEYRKDEFQTVPEDRPLVAHFSANNPSVSIPRQLTYYNSANRLLLSSHWLLMSHTSSISPLLT